MDNKTFISGMARQLDKDPKEIEILVEGLSTVIRDKASNLDSVAIPGFGRFDPVKSNEYVAVDPSSGKQTLFPPEIRLRFTPGTMLKKRLSNE